jgi:hypothetical protein
MIWVSKGDKLPSVAFVQDALNTALEKERSRRKLRAGGEGAKPAGRKPEELKLPEKLTVDGHFGEKTKGVAVAFQKLMELEPDGVVGPDTWKKLGQHASGQIIDVVDMADPTTRYVNTRLERLGSTPLHPPFLSNALAYIAKQVTGLVEKKGKVGILRLFGHGNAGHQNLSKGLGGFWIDPKDPKKPRGDPRVCQRGRVKDLDGRRACVYPSSGGQALALGDRKKEGGEDYHELFRLARTHLAPLRGCFCDYGSLEMHGCQIGKGKDGNKLVGMLALYLSVPVVASRQRGGVKNTKELLRVEMPRRIWFPLGQDMDYWVKSKRKS